MGGGWKSSLVGTAEAPSSAARRRWIVWDSWSWVADKVAEAARSEVRTASRDAIWARRRVVSEDAMEVESGEDEDGAVDIGCDGGRGGGTNDGGVGWLWWLGGSDDGGGADLARVDACYRAEIRLPVALVRDMAWLIRSLSWM